MRHRACFLTSLAAVMAIAAALPAPAEQPAPEPAGEVVDFVTDPTTRMTVAVNIEGKGPYPFIIDTGAQRTVISRELARQLDLDQGPVAELHSMSGMRSVQTVIIPSLELNRRAVKDIRAPALAGSDIGAAGILGIDSLQSQRVLLDFKAQTMTVHPATEKVERWDGKTIVVKARSRFGQLVLANATADGERIWVIIDTGTQVSVGNEALRRKLSGRKKKDAKIVELISVTGGSTPAAYTKLDKIELGGVEINDMPVAFADVHPFRKLDLIHRPALLLGMDALRLFDRVSVDFANRKVRFMSGDGARRETETQLAGRAPFQAIDRNQGRFQID